MFTETRQSWGPLVPRAKHSRTITVTVPLVVIMVDAPITHDELWKQVFHCRPTICDIMVLSVIFVFLFQVTVSFLFLLYFIAVGLILCSAFPPNHFIVFCSLYFSLAYFMARRPWTSDGGAIANDWLIDWLTDWLYIIEYFEDIYWQCERA